MKQLSYDVCNDQGNLQSFGKKIIATVLDFEALWLQGLLYNMYCN